MGRDYWELCNKQTYSENKNFWVSKSVTQSISRFQDVGAQLLERYLREVEQGNFNLEIVANNQENMSLR